MVKSIVIGLLALAGVASAQQSHLLPMMPVERVINLIDTPDSAEVLPFCPSCIVTRIMMIVDSNIVEVDSIKLGAQGYSQQRPGNLWSIFSAETTPGVVLGVDDSYLGSGMLPIGTYWSDPHGRSIMVYVARAGINPSGQIRIFIWWERL